MLRCVILNAQEVEALEKVLKEFSALQAKAFMDWKITKEPMPEICESMQDVSYFLNKLENTNAKQC